MELAQQRQSIAQLEQTIQSLQALNKQQQELAEAQQNTPVRKAREENKQEQRWELADLQIELAKQATMQELTEEAWTTPERRNLESLQRTVGQMPQDTPAMEVQKELGGLLAMREVTTTAAEPEAQRDTAVEQASTSPTRR